MTRAGRPIEREQRGGKVNEIEIGGLVEELVRDRVERSIQVKKLLLADAAFQASTSRVAMEIVNSLRTEGTVFFCGNGGSAADSQHLAAEFTGRYLKERRALPAIALNSNSSSMTAIGNDYGFDLVFARQLEALGKKGDVVVGISTSGNSPNVIRALEVAKRKSMFAAALTGASGNKLASVADCVICVPSNETPRIQECHILIGHIICEIVENILFDD
jgi:D-sedoheptulose 7-phosphate isomerase